MIGPNSSRTSEPPTSLRQALDAFGRTRLLAFDRDAATRGPTVEVSHEALLREWPLLRDWLRESRGEVRLQRQLAQAATEWAAANRDSSFLLSGARLAQFEAWRASATVALTADEQALIEASLAERERRASAEAARVAREVALQRRARRILQALVIVFLGAAVVAGGLAWWANVERTNAQTQAAILLAQQAENEVENGNSDRAVLLALEALTRYPYTPQAEHALGQAVTLGRAERFLTGHTSTVGGVAWSPDGTRVATGSTDLTVRIWDVTTGKEVRRADTDNQAYSVAWSPDGSKVLFTTGDRFRYFRGDQGVDVFLWQVDDVAPERIYEAPTYPIVDDQNLSNGVPEKLMVAENTAHAAAFSPDGRHLAFIADRSVVVWDIAEAEQALRLQGHTDLVYSIAWSPDGSRIVTSGQDGQVLIWDAINGQFRRSLGKPEGVITAAVWSPTGDRVAAALKESGVVIWAVESGVEMTRIPVSASYVWDIAWAPDDERLATADESGAIQVWNVATSKNLFTLRGHEGRAVSVAWSEDGRHLLSGAKDSTAYIWKATPGTEAVTLAEPTNQIGGADWTSDGRRLLTAGGTWFELGLLDGFVREWEASSGREVRTFAPAQDALYQVAIAPDGRRFFTRQDPGIDGKDLVFVWDFTTGAIINQFAVVDRPAFVRDAAWSPDGSRIAVVTSSGLARVYDAGTGKVLTEFNGHPPQAFLIHVAWSPDGRWIATTTGDGESMARVWDPATGEEKFALPSDDGVNSVAWSPSGDRICTASGDVESGGTDNAIRLWDAGTGRLQITIRGHLGGLWRCGWSPNGQRVFSASIDGTTRIYDAATGAELLTLPTPTPWFLDAFWSPTDEYLATIGDEQPARLWRVWQTTQDLIDYARECCVIRELTTKERAQFALGEP